MIEEVAYARQGTLDGFCGLYAAAHIIAMQRTGNYRDRARVAFHGLLRSCEDLDLLTANRIAGPHCGFSDLMIARIFNASSARVRGRLQALAFRSARFAKSRFAGKPGALFSGGASLVVQQDGDAHWIAVMGSGDDARYRCYDPEGRVETRERLVWKQGVLIAPAKFIGEF